MPANLFPVALTAERLANFHHFLSLPAGCWHSPEVAETAIQDLLAEVSRLTHALTACQQCQAGHELDCAALTMRAEKAEARVVQQQDELGSQEVQMFRLIRDTKGTPARIAHPAATPANRHSWRDTDLRGGGNNECTRCGLVVTKLRNRETNHFEVRYHQPDGLSAKAGKCTPPTPAP